ncbi:LPXTG specific sortase A [Staphylococcus aureus]|nr:LPXTG specific sortase A [Staphylococcus aureus]
MKKWTNRLMTIAGVVLILVAAYLFAKPHIDNYLTIKIKMKRLNNMIKM